MCRQNLRFRNFLLTSLLFSAASCSVSKPDILVVGGGTGGTAAGLKAASLGAKTVIVEPTGWLGGMISAAGVTATDGNHKLASGLWDRFRNKLYEVYGGPAAVETGWVSNTFFEPHVADSIFKTFAAAEKNLKVNYGERLYAVKTDGNRITSVTTISITTGKKMNYKAKTYVDATELGDLIKMSGEGYDLGLEDQKLTGEDAGIHASENVVQDLTYVATLKDFGPGADKTIPKPANYTTAEFDGASTDYYVDTTLPKPRVDAKSMMDYGKLPNGKYMINWPLRGNDTYLNNVEMPYEQREQSLEQARQTTLRFVYFIQTQLGYKNLGLADDEFNTKDKLALIPYYREGRRVHGLVRFTLPYIKTPFSAPAPLYRTGISVGDYPIDHHHKKNLAAPQHLEFAAVPSFNVPLGALIPQKIRNMIVAEKGISVSNVVNGTTRLQPCVMLTGEAAGTLAALSAQAGKAPKQIPVREVQSSLIESGNMIMPYIDVQVNDKDFRSIQRIGATGILRGTGIPYKWANQTWFYPDSLVETQALNAGIADIKNIQFSGANKFVTVNEAIALANKMAAQLKTGTTDAAATWRNAGLGAFEPNRFITRREMAVLLDKTAHPFENLPIDINGKFLN